jgi:hypothetical protein
MNIPPRAPSRRWWAWLAALWLLPQPALAQEDDADDYAEQSLTAAEEMYLGTDFDGAIEVLTAAIDKCGDDACTTEHVVKLHLLYAEVLVSGLDDRPGAKAQMRMALDRNPELELDPDVDSKALFELHAEVLEDIGPVEPKPKPGPNDGDGPSEPEEPTEDVRRNWIRVAFMVDLAIQIAEDDVCTRAGQDERGWTCTRADDTIYRGVPTAGQQDSVPTALQLSTMRAVLGYERVLGDNFTLGLRAGYAFRPLTGGNDDDFIPVHAEGRAAYWFGDEPFRNVVRPSLSIVGGFGPGVVTNDLTVIEDGQACAATEPITGDCTRPTDPARDFPEPRAQALKANKIYGPGFAGLAFGLSFSPTPLLMIDIGARITALFPVFELVATPEAGLSFGF